MSNDIFKSRYKTALILFIIANISGMLNTIVYLTTMLATGGTPDVIQIIVWEFTGSYSAMLLSPVMLYLMFRHPVTKKNFINTVPVYLLTILILGALHTLSMYVSRSIIYDLAGWGKYYYGYLPYRYIMETLKVSMGYAVLCISISFYKSYKEKQEQVIKSIKLKEQLAKTRLALLKNQIHPHFLFNTLNMISSVMFEDVHKADRMIASLSDLLRATLRSTDGGIHKLEDEIKILDYYLDIMKERYKDKLDIVYQIKDECLGLMVPSFILQPLVENSIKHGMERLTYLNIIIWAEKYNDRLRLIIKDNGPGIQLSPENVFKKGIGLLNTRERLETLYGSNFEFTWQNTGDEGLILTILIPGQI
jgi:two-component system, LytTR family, sensor kinase